MLRPEQMSKVSVTGSKRVMDQVIETVHDLNLVHVSDYDGSWEGFDQGNPIEGADEASEKLVTVRSIESILDVESDAAERTRIVTDEALEGELEEIREQVNDLDDRRDELDSELRAVEEEIDAMEPFATLGIDLELLQGYDTLAVQVGRGSPDAVRDALAKADGIGAFDVFSEGDVVAAFARPAAGHDEEVLAEALVGADFAALSVPDAEGSPEDYVQDLQHRKQQLESDLDDVEDRLESVRLDAAGFLLAAEEQLSIDVQKREAPLSFATTENAFVAEGWIPTERYTEFVEALTDAVGEHVDVEELERAQYTSSGKTHSEAVADGGTVGTDKPPVIQDNPGLVKPFEVLVQAVSRPTYSELDPTVILFLTFPAFFGFMIGDLGYGILYTLIGYYLYSNFEGEAFKSMGGVTIFAGVFTMLFGILYGEIFGTHQVSKLLWEGALGMHGPPIAKGLSPAELEWAKAWLVVSVLAGVVHLNIGWIFDFVENYQLHDLKHAVFESGSWLLMLNGLWLWIFSKPQGVKPDLLYQVFASGEEAAIALGFTGFAPAVGYVGIAGFALGLVLLVAGEPIEAVEFLNVLVNALSYTRLAAVLLAKAGMAFAVNLLFFGAYQTEEGEFHFAYEGVQHVGEHGEVLFGGLMHGGVAMLLLGLVILVLGHALVLALGVTSAGLQAVRLEYVEFFGKFYEGGGDEYAPFGYERQFTTEE
ncbi:MAG: V-type ATP synthase subunit I [Haloferacaceae archaeon]